MSPTLADGDDQVEAARPRPAPARLRAVRHVGDARRVPHVEVEKLAEDDLVQLAVLGEDERVVQARDQQDVVDAETGEIREAG